MTTGLLTRRKAAPARWVVARLERDSGFTSVRGHRGALRIRVGDGGAGTGIRTSDSGSMVTAELDAAGGVVVETRTAPPALLVRPDGVQLLPAAPGLRLPAQMRAGDRLLLCSAAVLDSPPVGLVEILKAPAQKVLSMSPDELLRILLDGDHAGAAAVVIRAPLDPDIRSIDEGGRA